jgi:signal transduction histidine kinase/ligand-binding sensor domain-containing protein/CheY-like chemotaxis protein
MSRCRIIYLLVLLLCGIQVSGQKKLVQFDHLGVREGLPDGFITDITQDSKGYIWIGSYEGLYKYDGTNVIAADLGAANTSLTTNRIFDIEEDADSNLWIGTYIGLNKIEARTGKITRYVNIGSGKKIIPGNLVEHVFTDADNDIWIDTDGGIAKYSRSTDSFTMLDHAGLSFYSYCFFEDDDKTLWLGTNKGILFIDKIKLNVTTLPDTTLFAQTGRVVYIYKDRQQRIWLCTDRGLWLFDPKSKQVSRPDDIIPPGYRQLYIKRILQDVNNNYWLVANDSLLFLNTQVKKVTSFTREKDNPHSLSSNAVKVLYEDNNGNVWIGTNVDVNKINLAIRKFEFYQLFPGEEYNDLGNRVQRVHQRPDGSMFYYNHSELYYSKAPGQPLVQVKIPYKSFLEFFYNNPGGDLWVCFAASGKGVWKYVPGKNELQQVPISKEIDNMAVFQVEMDRDTAGLYWLGTINGLYKYDARTHRAVRIPPRHSINVPYPIVRRFQQSRSGKIWMDAGIILVSYDKRTGEEKEYAHVPGDSNSPGARVRGIIEAPDGRLWISYETGLSCLDEETGKFTNYTTRNGLKGGNIVYSLESDQRGRIWFTTFNYITSLDPSTGKFRYFSAADGINTSFNRGSWCKMNDGRIAFGGANGIVIFHPDSIGQSTNRPAVVINAVNINNKPYQSAIVPEYLDKVTVSYADKVVSFDFKALEFTAGHLNQYAYKMEGFDKDWVYAGAENKATYTNLDPGTYKFVVKATNYQGMWSERMAGIELVVLPLFWQQWWFRLLALLLVVALGYILWKNNREKYKLVQEKELAERNDKYKTQFLSNVSHEIRTPLNAIIGLNKLLQDTPLDARQHKYVHAASQSSESLLTLINDLLDQAKIESGAFQFVNRPFQPAVVVQQVYDTFLYKAEEKGLAIHTHISDGVPDTVSGDAVRLHQVLSNLVSNAIKFTESGHVSIKLQCTMLTDSKATLDFEVTDTGVGIEQDMHDKIFDSFRQLEDEHARVQIGTGLGLSISKQLIEQQGGRINVSSNPGQGSSFMFSISYYVPGATEPVKKEETMKWQLPANLQVLLVEDTPFNQLLAVEILKRNIKDIKVVVAENGREALDILANSQDFDIVLMDVKMPVMNGYETCMAIRNMDAEYYKQLPVIALTANAVPAQLAKCREAGMNDWVTKPIDSNTLLQKIHSVLNSSE